MQRQANHKSTPLPVPKRIYTFTVVLLASLIVGISFVSIQSYLSANNSVTKERSEVAPFSTRATNLSSESTLSVNNRAPKIALSPKQLSTLLGIAAGIGLISLIPSRKPMDSTPIPVPVQDPSLVAERTGMPVLASLFPAAPEASQRTTTPVKRGWLPTFVATCEIVLAVAVSILIFGSLSQTDILNAFIQNPLNGYANAVCHAMESVVRRFT